MKSDGGAGESTEDLRRMWLNNYMETDTADHVPNQTRAKAHSCSVVLHVFDVRAFRLAARHHLWICDLCGLRSLMFFSQVQRGKV